MVVSIDSYKNHGNKICRDICNIKIQHQINVEYLLKGKNVDKFNIFDYPYILINKYTW